MFTHCLRRRTFLINFLIFKTHRLLNGAIICKNTNHMFNAFIFCLRIVYALFTQAFSRIWMNIINSNRIQEISSLNHSILITYI